MTINIQTLHDALVAILTTIGVAAVVSIAFAAAAAFYERGKPSAGTAVRPVAAPAPPPTQTDDARRLVLR